MSAATTRGPMADRERPRRGSRTGWLAISGLVLLSAIPIIGGVIRLAEFGGDPESALPWPLSVAIVAHIVAMSTFCLLGAFQFSPALRTRRSWHRRVGRALIPAGLVAAVSSVPLGALFGGPSDERALAIVRVIFAVAMTIFLVQSVLAIRRRQFAAHGAWMTRAYAIAVSGGTQALVLILWSIVDSDIDVLGETWLVAVGFVINGLVAELLIRRRGMSPASVHR